MGTTRAALTDSDIRTLIKGATADERAIAAHKLCRVIDKGELTDEDRAKAADILRVMAADAAELVRRALAVTLKQSDVLPRDVALKLAKDVDSVCNAAVEVLIRQIRCQERAAPGSRLFPSRLILRSSCGRIDGGDEATVPVTPLSPNLLKSLQ